MSTPHNAAEKGEIAKVVLMPGDPLRAKFVAEHYLEDVRLFNEVRGMLGYTGTYEGVPVSVMGSGMGIPSMAIYSWELYHDYDVDTIIRIGTIGGLAPNVHLCDIVIAQAACTNSNIAASLDLPGAFAPIGDFSLIRKAVHACEELNATYHVGNVLSTDVFYSDLSITRRWANVGVLGVEMEAAGLYVNAIKAGKRAIAIATVSDCPLTGESLPAIERETSFTQMMKVALTVAKSESIM